MLFFHFHQMFTLKILSFIGCWDLRCSTTNWRQFLSKKNFAVVSVDLCTCCALILCVGGNNCFQPVQFFGTSPFFLEPEYYFFNHFLLKTVINLVLSSPISYAPLPLFPMPPFLPLRLLLTSLLFKPCAFYLVHYTLCRLCIDSPTFCTYQGLNSWLLGLVVFSSTTL